MSYQVQVVQTDKDGNISNTPQIIEITVPEEESKGTGCVWQLFIVSLAVNICQFFILLNYIGG